MGDGVRLTAHALKPQAPSRRLTIDWSKPPDGVSVQVNVYDSGRASLPCSDAKGALNDNDGYTATLTLTNAVFASPGGDLARPARPITIKTGVLVAVGG